MDNTEDLSARVVFKRILSAEEPRTSLTHSVSQRTRRSSRLNKPDADLQATSGMRRSSRLNKTDAAAAQTPRDILTRRMKHKIRESLFRESLPPRRRTISVLRKTNVPDPTLLLYADDDTPRHLLKNILREESVKSPLVHKEPVTKQSQLPSANSSINSGRPSIELSELDLPDVSIATAASTAKRLSRKRPRHSLNVTAFEKWRRDRDGENETIKDDVEKEGEESERDHSLSSTFSSSATLSLKTPYEDVGTEKRGIQRKDRYRRKVSVEEFGAALYKRQLGIEDGARGIEVMEQAHNETAHSEGFSLSLSVLTEPDITTDIVGCNTALYAQPDSLTSNLSIVATQDKPTVMASPLQGDMRGVKEEGQMEVEQTQNVIKMSSISPIEEEVESESETKDCASIKSQSEEDVHAAESQSEEENKPSSISEESAAATSQSEEEDGGAKSQTEGRNVTSTSGEGEDAVESQTEDEGAGYSKTEGNAAVMSQSEEEEFAAESQTEEEDPNGPQIEEDFAAQSDFEGEEGKAESQPEEEDTADSQNQEGEDAARPQFEEEELATESQTEESVEEEEEATDYQSNKEDPSANYQSVGEAGVTDYNTEEEHDGKQEDEEVEQESDQLARDFEHISRRAQRSEGGLVVPVREDGGSLEDTRTTETGWSNRKSIAVGTGELHSGLDVGSSDRPSFEVPDLAEPSTQGDPQNAAGSAELNPDADEENSGSRISESSLEEAADQEEEWEDEEDGERSEELKTPAFVRQKRHFFRPNLMASPTGHNTQPSSVASEGLPSAKPKRVRRRVRQRAKTESILPKSFLMGAFKHFAKTKVSPDVFPVLQEIMDKFFTRLADDLETYALHAKRKTIEFEDVELLLRRQGYVNDKVPVEVLIAKYLRMEQRKLLIPIATSGNVVIPKWRRR